MYIFSVIRKFVGLMRFQRLATPAGLGSLGLIHLRREQYDTSPHDLQEATADEANPDPTDLFILGADPENAGKWKKASDALTLCAQAGELMQDQGKQLAAGSK